MSTSVYLDTNVTNYIAEKDAATKVQTAFIASAFRPALSFDLITETARGPHALRALRYSSLSRLNGTFLRQPADYLGVLELVKEIRRCRPQWLKRLPSFSRTKEILRRRERVWRDIRDNPTTCDFEPGIKYVETSEEANTKFKAFQKQLRATRVPNHKMSPITLSTGDATFDKLIDGIDPFSRYVRIVSAHIWQGALAGVPSMCDLRDWLAPYLSPVEVSGEDFLVFWLRDVDILKLPRTRIQCMTEFLQLDRKAQRSNGIDAVHAVYLMDTDIFLTADRALYEILQLLKDRLVDIQLSRLGFVTRAAPDACTEVVRAAREAT